MTIFGAVFLAIVLLILLFMWAFSQNENPPEVGSMMRDGCHAVVILVVTTLFALAVGLFDVWLK